MNEAVHRSRAQSLKRVPVDLDAVRVQNDQRQTKPEGHCQPFQARRGFLPWFAANSCFQTFAQQK
jgi:hypothetical protein